MQEPSWRKHARESAKVDPYRRVDHIARIVNDENANGWDMYVCFDDFNQSTLCTTTYYDTRTVRVFGMTPFEVDFAVFIGAEDKRDTQGIAKFERYWQTDTE